MFLYERIIEGFKFLVACPNNSPAPSDAEFDPETLKIGDDTVLTYNSADGSHINPVFLRTSQTPKVYTEPTNIDTEFSENFLGGSPSYVNYNGVIWELEDGDSDSIWVKTSMTIEEADNEWKEITRIKFFYQKLLDIYCNVTPNEEIPVQIPLENDIQIIPMVGNKTLFEWFERKIKYLIEVETESTADTPTISVSLTAGGKEIQSGAYVEKGTVISGTVEYTMNYVLDEANITIDDSEPTPLSLTDDNTKFEFTIQDNTKIYITEIYSGK